MQENKRILLTGGHAAATSYAFIKHLRKKESPFDIWFIGAKSAVEGSSVKTLESKILPPLGVNFVEITSGRIQRRFTKHTIPALLKIPVGLFQAIFHLLKIKPDVTLSFGGYTAFPVVVASYLLGIPVILHEQTSVVGRANKFSEFFAKKVALSRKSSSVYFDDKKATIVGNPISDNISLVKPKTNLSGKPTIFVTGGSRGSEFINKIIYAAKSELSKKYNIIHQVGEANISKYKPAKNYRVYGIIPPSKWYQILGEADIIISRSGANIVSEILLAKRPAILVPLPFTYLDEQAKNAQYAKQSSGVIVVKQDDFDKKVLSKFLSQITNNYSKMVSSMQKFKSEDKNASEKLLALLKPYLN